MTTTPTLASTDPAADMTALLDSLAKPQTGPEPVDSLSVYFSALAKNRKGGWIVNVRRGSLVQHVELRSADTEDEAREAAAKLFAVRS